MSIYEKDRIFFKMKHQSNGLGGIHVTKGFCISVHFKC